eukprot:scaffold12211_cov116-Isochrysis_galbana.AAC.9
MTFAGACAASLHLAPGTGTWWQQDRQVTRPSRQVARRQTARARPRKAEIGLGFAFALQLSYTKCSAE